MPEDSSPAAHRPIHSESRARLVEGIAKARYWLDQLVSGEVADTQQIAAREGTSDRSIRMTLNLAFLTPDLVTAAIHGHLPYGTGLVQLTNLPANWSRQRDLVLEAGPGRLHG